jgi:hypothetical protein
MNYVLLIYESDTGIAKRRDPVDAPAYMGGWMTYSKALVDAGAFAGGSGLQTIETATTLTHNGDKWTVQDGPFAETKEQLGGFFIIDVPDLDAALAWAERAPIAPGGKVEVRPTMVRPS